MKIINRIFQYIDYKEFTPSQAEKLWGLSNGYLAITLKRNGDIGESKIAGILENSRDLSDVWLVFGRGNMLVSEKVEMSDPIPLIANDPQGSYLLTQTSSTINGNPLPVFQLLNCVHKIVLNPSIALFAMLIAILVGSSGKKKGLSFYAKSFIFKSPQYGSNQRPTDYKSVSLLTMSFIVSI